MKQLKTLTGQGTIAVNSFVRVGNKTPPSLSRWMSGFCTTLICYVVKKPDNHRDELGGVVLLGLRNQYSVKTRVCQRFEFDGHAHKF